MENAYWEGKHFACFANAQCEYFPCHPVAEGQRFNCLFCYCPLYVLGRDCGGTPVYLENGVKDCSACSLPHQPKSYGYIMQRFADITAAEQQLRETIERKGK